MKNEKNRPLQDLDDEDLIKQAETGDKAMLQVVMDEACARDDERNHQK